MKIERQEPTREATCPVCGAECEQIDESRYKDFRRKKTEFHALYCCDYCATDFTVNRKGQYVHVHEGLKPLDGNLEAEGFDDNNG